jgi:accessory gene regulator protein AgrB
MGSNIILQHNPPLNESTWGLPVIRLNLVYLVQALIGSMTGTSLLHHLYVYFRVRSIYKKLKYGIMCTILSYISSPVSIGLAKKYLVDIDENGQGTVLVSVLLTLALLPLASYVSKITELDKFLTTSDKEGSKVSDLTSQETEDGPRSS